VHGSTSTSATCSSGSGWVESKKRKNKKRRMENEGKKKERGKKKKHTHTNHTHQLYSDDGDFEESAHKDAVRDVGRSLFAFLPKREAGAVEERDWEIES